MLGPVARFGRRGPQGLPVAREWRPVRRPRPSCGAQFPWGRARSALPAGPIRLSPALVIYRPRGFFAGAVLGDAIGAALGLVQIGSDVHRDFEQLDELTRSKQAGMADHDNAGGMRFSSGLDGWSALSGRLPGLPRTNSARCGSSAFRSFSTPPPLSISRPRARASATVNGRDR